MSGKRPRVRAYNEDHSYNLYPPETERYWRVIRIVRFEQAESKVAAGEWRRDFEADGQPCYRVIPTHEKEKDLPSGRTSVSITARESMLNAFAAAFRDGRSRTVVLTEEQRLSRRDSRGKALPPEDAVERAVAKVREWPKAHGDRAVRVYPPKPAR